MRKEKQGLEIWAGLSLRISNFLASFTHANTADRTYNLPNKSGTFALLDDISGSTVQSGIGTIDFGDSGSEMASVVITGQATILTTSKIFVCIRAEATSNNSYECAIIEDIRLIPGYIIMGTSFTVFGICKTGIAQGKYNFSWMWI